jgi:DNA polymerase-1
MFIGEAPGAEEDISGKPFLGKAGQLLDRVLYEAGVLRSSLAIANAVACRPTDNRKPLPKEVAICWKHLDQEIRELKPELIVPLGDTAMKRLLPGVGTITKIHGQWFISDEYKCRILPLYHPAYVLRNEADLIPKFREDLRKVAAFLAGDGIPEAAPTDYYVVETMAQLDWMVEQLHSHSRWACDLETSGFSFLKDHIFIASFSWEEYTAVLVDVRAEELQAHIDEVWEKLAEVFGNDSEKILHNGSFDIEFLLSRGIHVENYYADTLLMHYLLNENTRHGLEILAYEFTDKGGYELPLQQYVAQNKIESYEDIPPDMIHPYALGDADVTLRSFNKMLPRIYEEGLERVLFEVMMPASVVLIMTEMQGVSIDLPYLQKTKQKYQEMIDEQKMIVYATPQVVAYEEERKAAIVDEFQAKYVGSRALQNRFAVFDDYLASRAPEDLEFRFNPASNKQLRELLIDRMKLPVVKYTKKGKKNTTNPSLDAEVLEVYATKHKHKFCAALSRISTLQHLKSTFLDGIESQVDENGRVHTDYRLFGTVTGRPSSREPNLNNIPRTGTADDIKDIFCADPGQWLIEVDESQAEFRMWINYSKDKQALRDLAAGIDIHKLMAAAANGVAIPKGDISHEVYLELVKDVTKADRQNAKMVVFGLMYGRGADSVAAQLGISKAAAEDIIEQFFSRYPEAKMWLARQISRARMEGYVTNLFGRRRRLPELHNDPKRQQRVEKSKIEEAGRQAQNAPIQGGASDLVLSAAVRIAHYMWSHHMKSRMVLTVYDSLIFSCTTEELWDVIQLVHNEMVRKPEGLDIVVDLEAEVKVGRNWGSLFVVDPVKEKWEDVYHKLIQHVQGK